MARGTLYNKVWDHHKVATLPTGQDQLLIGLHLIHEVTSPQAFAMLRERGSQVAFPNRTYATLDHIIPTENPGRPYVDAQAELMVQEIEKNTAEFGVKMFDPESERQGVVHIVGPELGLTLPGMTIACGDSHTSTHGAFGSLAFGIGTTEVRDVLETQTLALSPMKVRKVVCTGTLKPGVFAKDVALKIIQVLGVKGGLGYAYEYAGEIFDSMTLEERMTVCNMSIEGGARIGYVNPDQTTYDYIKGREYAPSEDKWAEHLAYWDSIQSDADAEYDDVVEIDMSDLAPMVTWGINPGQSLDVSETLPDPSTMSGGEGATASEAYTHMQLNSGDAIAGTKIDVAFVGSCTNGRISDMREAAKIVKGRSVAEGVKAFVVPGSQQVKKQAEEEGLDKIFQAAGVEWRNAGCSMCLAMNPDKLVGDQLSASSSNRNFIGRQGSKTGRTLLMSPAMVAAAMVTGTVTDVRELIKSESE